jgi:hypothetical protein
MAHGKIYDLRFTGDVAKEADVLGHKTTFHVKDYTDQVHPTSKFACKCEAVFVLNKSGGTLAKGRRVLVSTDATYFPGVAVAGLGGVDVPFVGVVSPFIAGATVADGDGFWLITKGLTKIGYGTGTPNFAVGDKLATAANGCVTEWTDYTDIFVGYAGEAKTSGSEGDLMWAYLACNTCY